MPKTPDYFAGKTIVITGAGSGIGRATALIFAREGANVVCADLNEAAARQTAGEVNGKGSQALALKVDVTKRAQVEDMARRAIDAFGSVQFLFNSAGAALRRSKFLDIDDDLIDRTFDLNVKGTLYGMQAVLPHMLKNGFGVIVNVGSMAHRRGGPGSSIHYAASKGAVVTMTMGVAREFATRHGVHIVLKGARSVIGAPDGRIVINPTGNPGMASGGTGDVLTGILGAFLARGLAPDAALQAAVYLHGRAGDLAARRLGEEALIARDVIAALPEAFQELGGDDD